MNLALIGNCSYQALIDDRAAVKWLCLPRFDSSFVFGSLLDSERGGEFSITAAEGDASSTQAYIPRTNILRTEIEAASGRFEVVDWAPRFSDGDLVYRPRSLFRRVRRLAGAPRIRVRYRPVYDYGRRAAPSELCLDTNAPLEEPFALESDVYLALRWDGSPPADLADTAETYLARTRAFWEAWSDHANLPFRHRDAVIRSALALELFRYEDTGAITAAATTSLPEYPGAGRNWDYRFCWLRDAYFSLDALARLGKPQAARGFIDYLVRVVEDHPDRVQPLYAVDGEASLEEHVLEHLDGYQGDRPVRVGNGAYLQQQHDVYGEMLAALAPAMQPGVAASRRAVFDSMLGHIEQHLQSPDAGLWEKRDAPALHTFSLLMHWFGASVAHAVAESLADTDLSERSRALRARARDIIESRCFRPELGYYADTVDSDHADASLFLMVNLGYLPADSPRVISHIEGLAAALSANDHLLYRYLHHDGIGQTHATFTVCGFWYAEALARIGRTDQAARVFESLLGHANHVGLLSEDIDPRTGLLWGNLPQTYSHVGVINTAFALG